MQNASCMCHCENPKCRNIKCMGLLYVGVVIMVWGIDARRSKYPIFEGSGNKYHAFNGFWKRKPQGMWILRVLHIRDWDPQVLVGSWNSRTLRERVSRL